jgi:Zn-dependent protease with chaperone function
MKFIPRSLGEAAENSSGGGTRSQLRELLILGSLACLSLIGLFFIAGWITDFAVERISPEKEAKLFAGYSRAFTQEPSIPEELTKKWDTAQRLLKEIVAASELSSLDFKLGFMPAEEPNAFAIPGGGIVLTRGLLETIETDIGLAFVLAHELGHFAHRDHLRRLSRQIGFKATLTLLLGQSSSLTMSAADLMLLHYSREREAAADDYAINLLHMNYGATEGAEELFRHFEEEGHLPSWAYMFTSHPDNLERLKNIRQNTQ